MSRVKMCRFCAFMTCGDANWCSASGECLSDEYIREENDCKAFEFNPIDVITHTECYPHAVNLMRRHKEELALYQRRMAGDWS